ncbi:MAG: ABC transporter permease [Thermoplasmata archaeon]|nr:ABC transporter permease [Thermoplasmata archaeon]
MYNIIGEAGRVAYGDLCFLRRHLLETIISSMVGPLLYLIAFAYGMRSGDTEAGVSYVAYAIPGIVAMSSMTAGFTSTAQKIMIQRLFHSSFDEMVLCPMHTSSIVLGKSVIGMLKGLMGSMILLVLGLFLTPDLMMSPQLVLCVIFSCLMFSMLGVSAGLLARSSATLNVFNSLVILPMTFLCGTIFSVSALPSIVGDIVWLLPLTHSSEVIRAAALGWDTPWVSLLVMLVYFAFFYAMDWWIIRRKLY